MGQDVEIRKTATIGEILLIDTDRSFTGQDGHAIGPDLDGDGVPVLLARKLFDLDLGIDHMYVLQNTVSVRRPGGWNEAAAKAVTETTNSFLRFYAAELDAPEPADETNEEE